jgi:hypothetical protein
LAVCVSTCGSSDANEDWWSNAADEPFAWPDMIGDFGFTKQFAIYGTGSPG